MIFFSKTQMDSVGSSVIWVYHYNLWMIMLSFADFCDVEIDYIICET